VYLNCTIDGRERMPCPLNKNIPDTKSFSRRSVDRIGIFYWVKRLNFLKKRGNILVVHPRGRGQALSPIASELIPANIELKRTNNSIATNLL